MEAMSKGWTDERLDGFRDSVESRFDRVDERIEVGVSALARGQIAMTTVVAAGFVGVATAVVAGSV
jgi:hypothetical protein